MNNEIKQDMIKYFTDDSVQKIFIDMRSSKGYTDELEELSKNDADNDVTILLTKAAEKNETQSLSLFASWISVCNHK